MKRSNLFSFHSSSYHPTNKKLRSRRTQKLRRTAEAKDTLDSKQQAKGKQYNDEIQYGHAVPRKYIDCIRIDNMNGNNRWKEAVAKEVAALLNLQCFDIQSPDFKPDNKYQYVHMHWVYAVKQDLTYKARLICDK